MPVCVSLSETWPKKGWPCHDRQVSPVPVLHELYVYVTNGCNCACRHCWIVPEDSGKAGRPVHFIDSEIFAAAIEEAMPLGLNSVKWTGGEPTIHPAFEKLLKIQNEYGLGGRIETNGMKVTAEMAELLQECGVTGVSVSLDGAPAATHDAVRNVSGGFKRTLTGIKIWSRLRLPTGNHHEPDARQHR